MGKHIFILTACTCEAALTKTVARSICEGLTSMVKKTLTYTENLKVKETKTTETNKRSAGGGCVQQEEAVKREDRVSQDFVFAPVIEYHVCGLFIYPHFISRIAVTAKIKKLSTETCLRWRLKWSVFRRGQTVPLLSKSSLSCRASGGTDKCSVNVWLRPGSVKAAQMSLFVGAIKQIYFCIYCCN